MTVLILYRHSYCQLCTNTVFTPCTNTVSSTLYLHHTYTFSSSCRHISCTLLTPFQNFQGSRAATVHRKKIKSPRISVLAWNLLGISTRSVCTSRNSHPISSFSQLTYRLFPLSQLTSFYLPLFPIFPCPVPSTSCFLPLASCLLPLVSRL
jgi:hypothetical protein